MDDGVVPATHASLGLLEVRFPVTERPSIHPDSDRSSTSYLRAQTPHWWAAQSLPYRERDNHATGAASTQTDRGRLVAGQVLSRSINFDTSPDRYEGKEHRD